MLHCIIVTDYEIERKQIEKNKRKILSHRCISLKHILLSSITKLFYFVGRKGVLYNKRMIFLY